MAERTERPLFLASRGEDVVDDFDGGGVRVCRSVRRVHHAYVIEVDPPIREGEAVIRQVVVAPRFQGGDLPPPSDRAMEVHVAAYKGDEAIRPGVIDSHWWAQIALDPGLFSETTAEESERYLAEVRAFSEANGRVGPPYPDTEEGWRVSNLVHNFRMDHGYGHLDPETEKALEAIPGWTWSD